MTDYKNPVDICNRTAQHLGVRQIADFNEDTVQAGEFGFAYDKLRKAELQRNVWEFAIRTAAIRPIDTGFMSISATLWSSTVTYGYGALVSDVDGKIWQSKLQNNVNQGPGNDSGWELYCGPMMGMPYDRTGATSYFSGEIVYETPGDGTYTAYMCLTNSNSNDPRAPTPWDSTTQYSKNQVVQYYAAYAAATAYSPGDVVYYSSAVYVCIAATTGNLPTDITYWYPVNLTLAPGFYDSATTYAIGDMVTYGGTNYVCILASTGNLPTNVTYWAAFSMGSIYVSLIDFNLNNDPTSDPIEWSATTNYAVGNQVSGSDGYIYTAAVASYGKDPTATTGIWTNTGSLAKWSTVNSFGSANTGWITINAVLSDTIFTYPVGAGPNYQSATKNVYRLPANFLRRAPQDPKAGSVSFLGAPTGLMYDDWNLSGDYLVSRESQPILLRFVANVTSVNSMDAMFCELLAARIALETCERVTGSTQKLSSIGAMYREFAGEARLVNAILTGSDEPPEDDWITTRL